MENQTEKTTVAILSVHSLIEEYLGPPENTTLYPKPRNGEAHGMTAEVIFDLREAQRFEAEGPAEVLAAYASHGTLV